MAASLVIRQPWALVGLFLLSLAVRFSRLDTSPPGIGGDAARLGLHTLDFLYRGSWPFYIYHQGAPESLINYLQAPVFLVFGFGRTALRGVTAFADALAAPAAYVAGRELLAGHGLRFARRAGLVAAIGLALSPFTALFSRHGIEGALVPVLELMTVAALWRGLRRGRRLDFVLAGIVLGVSQYAYIVARAFPVALAGACLVALILDYRPWLTRWRGLFLAVLVACLLALPQWLLFVQAPYALVARTQQSAGQLIFELAAPGRVLVDKLVHQLLMLGWHWETGYNPFSGRPLLNPVLFGGLLVAVGTVFRRRQAAVAFSMVIAALMLIPDLITYEGLTPSATRLAAAVPLIFVFAATGCAVVWGWLSSRPGLPVAAGWLVPCAVVLAGFEGQWDFSRRVQPQVAALDGLEWRASLIEMAEAEYIAAHADNTLLVPASEFQRAPLAFLLAEQFPRRKGGISVPLRAGERVTIVAPLDPERPTTDGVLAGYIVDEWVLLKARTAYFLPPLPNSVSAAGAARTLYASNGAAAATTYAAEWLGVSPQIEAISSSFANGLDLVGFHTTELRPGQPITVTLYWQPRRRVTTETQIFTQILDRHHNPVAAIHDWPLHGTYRVSTWQPGEVVPLSYTLDIPPDLAPGAYHLTTGVFDLLKQARVPLLAGGDHAVIASLKLPLPAGGEQPAQRIAADFGVEIGLAGYTISEVAGALQVDLFWEARRVPAENYTVFLHVVDATGNIVAQVDAEPLYGQYPTSIWDAGERVLDRRVMSIEDVAAGQYQILVGLYQWPSLRRLPARLQGRTVPDARLPLAVLTLP